VTFLVMIIDPKTHAVTLVNAGHLSPVLRRRDGTVEAIGRDTSGLPLGIVPELEYEEAAFSLKPGETILAFTDGVTEAMTEQKEIFGRDRLLKLISRSEGTVESLVEGVVDDVEKFTAGSDSRDDTCLIGVQRLMS